MYVEQAVLPRLGRLRRAVTLSREAKRRLAWMDYYVRHGRNAKLTYRHFGISSATFYRWWHRYDPRNLRTLEDDWQTRRPHAVRQPETPPRWSRRFGRCASAIRGGGRPTSWSCSARTGGRSRRPP